MPFPASHSHALAIPPCSWMGCLPRTRYPWASIKQLSNVNYEQRDNFQMEIAAVEQANRREQDDFENQVRKGWRGRAGRSRNNRWPQSAIESHDRWKSNSGCGDLAACSPTFANLPRIWHMCRLPQIFLVRRNAPHPPPPPGGNRTPTAPPNLPCFLRCSSWGGRWKRSSTRERSWPPLPPPRPLPWEWPGSAGERGLGPEQRVLLQQWRQEDGEKGPGPGRGRGRGARKGTEGSTTRGS